MRADEYFVTTPVTKEATIQVGGATLPILPVYPNQVVGVTTPPAGISGPLVYAKDGNAADFNGKKIEGSIAVLNFNSGMNWITAIDLGARAVIFLAPGGLMGGISAWSRKYFVLVPDVGQAESKDVEPDR